MIIGLWTAGTASLDLAVLWKPPLNDGMSYNRQGVVVGVDDHSPASASGIRAGDRIAKADAAWFHVWPSPQIESVKIIRNGVTRTVALRTVAYALAIDDQARVLAGAVVFFTFLTVGSTLVLLRPSRMTWAFYLFCASTLLVSVGGSYFTGSLELYWTVAIVNQYLHGVGDGAMLIFAARFPDDAPAGWRKWVERAGLAVCLLYPPFLVNAWQLRWLAGNFTPTVMDFVVDVVYVTTYIAAITTFLMVYAQSRGLERHRIQWALVFPIVLSIRTPAILQNMTH